MKKDLKTMIVVAMLALMSNFAIAQTFTYPVEGKQGFSLSEKTRDGLHVSYNLGQFTLSPLNYRGEAMSEISISGVVLPNTEGCPNLPVESRMLAVPQGAEARLNVIHAESEIIRDVDIAPALRIQAETEEPEFNYVKNQAVYGKNAFYPENPFTIERSSIRGVDVVAVSVSPFQYNPVTKELKVYTNIELSVSYEGGNGHFGDDRLRSPYWDPILAAELMNYDQLPVIDYAARMQQWLRDEADGAEYLIITPNNDAWAEYANQLRDYRTRQGILTKVYRLDEMPASSTSEMKAWFHNAYNTWTIPPAAVCLLGDHGTNMSQYIPAESVSHPSSGTCITDNGYADVTGDNLPDIVFSRLVAQNASELPVFVGKQIEYEYGNPNMNASFYTSPITALGWQTSRWFQLCSEVFGGYMRGKGYTPSRINCIYDGTPGNQWSTAQNTSMPVSYFGPDGTNYIPASPSEMGGWTGGSPDQVVQAVNNGSFWLQHRDHGGETGWGEPAFRNNHVAQLNNVGKLPFVMSINCLTGKFNYSSNCFCEAWMRHTYNGQNAGAVGLLCPTEVSYSFVNDAFVWGIYDLFDGDFMPDYGPYAAHTGNWMPAFGNVAGKYFLQQTSWPYNSNSKDITYTMFTAHCDAFLRVYTQVPRTMNVDHPLAVVAGVGGMDVTAPSGCMISLVKQNDDGGWDILAVEEAIGSVQTIAFEPQFPATEINLVVTGQDYLRYEDVVSVVPAEGSYLAVTGYEPSYAPINQETSLSLTIQNVGLEATAESTTVVLTTSDNRLSILDDTAQLGIIAPETTVTLTDAFSFIIDENAEDNTRFPIDVTMTCGSQTWTGMVYVTAGQAILEYEGMSWAGGYVPGDTLDITATFKNTGHYHAFNALAHISSTCPYVSFENDSVAIGTIEADSQVESVFTAVVSPSCPENEEIPLVFTMNADGGLVAEGQDVLVNTCSVIFNLHDSFGDGWNGNILNVSFSNGLPDEHLTIQSGSSASYAFLVGNNVHITLTWTEGSWLNECSFEIVYENQVQMYKSSGLGSNFLYEFDLDCAAQFNPLDVTVVANPEGGGTVTGAGTYEPGETCTITATPSEDYTFVRWTEDGTFVSSNPTYSFPVLANRNFVATFSPPINVTVSANPTEGGTVTGSGIYDYGTSVTITATANEGYVFLRWKSNGYTVSSLSSYSFTATSNVNYVAEFEQVSHGFVIGEPTYTNAYLPTYTYYPYTLSQQIYTVDEMGGESCEITSVSFYNTGYSKTRNLTVYLVHTDKTTFESSTDWITVSESDQVFSGNVVMTASGWATIYFGTPFVYDGISNLALVVNDKTGSWNSGASCRTFNAQGTQALRIYRGNTGFDPLNPSSYEGTLVSVKNQVFFGHPSFEYTVTATANPEDGGTVSGGEGYYYLGQYCTLTATANENYGFYNWTKDGTVVSTDATYTFQVTGNMNLVANFGPPISISVISSPEEGGTVSGGGEYGYNQPCTLTAIPNEGYVFNYWTKNGSVVSCVSPYTVIVTAEAEYVANFQQKDGIIIGDATHAEAILPSCSEYPYSMTQQIYTVDEINSEACEISCVSFFNTGECNTRNLTIYMVNTDKTAFESSTDWITVTEADRVFSNEVEMDWRSWTTIYFDTPFYYDGSSNVALVVNDETGYSGWDMTCRTFDTQDTQTLYVCDYEYTYAPYSPYNLSGYYGTLMSEKNQVVFGMPNYAYMVTLSANPEEGGTVSGGGGPYYYGQHVPVSATANPGYVFNNWTKFDEYNWYYEVVSCLSNDNIPVTETCEYVANFQPMDGIIIGEAVQTNANLPGCSEYPYSMTQQIYTADEINSEACEISSVSFFNAGYYNTCNLTIYMVNTDKAVFASETDWITVTEADMVYSGNVTMEEFSWTTIYFNTPFYYDGSSNVALIVNDETIDWYSGMSCRTFDTPDPQAIYVCDYDYYYNAFNPYNPSAYYGTLMWEKNQVVFGIAIYQYMATVFANPEEGGMVSGGGGPYYYGQPIPVSATANPGYVFNNWTKFDEYNWYYEVVSCLSNDNIPVTGNSEIVANFQQMDGIVIGDAVQTNAYLPSFSDYPYSMSQQIYTADEINSEACEISSVSFFNAGYYNPRNLTIYMVNTSKTAFESGTDWITVTEADMVFSGSVTFEETSWKTIYFNTTFNYDGSSNVALIVYDETGDWYSSMSCRTFDTPDPQAIYVYDYDSYYSPINPYNLSNYYGTIMWEKNQVVFGIAIYQYMVTLSADPEEGGTVSGGGGPYYYGQSIPISTTTNDGYVFDKWTKDGGTVSYFTSDDITVTETAEYVAGFDQFDGIIIGDAIKDSYYLPTYYYYSLSQQIYTAEEMNVDEACEISSVSFYNTGSRLTRKFTIYMVNTDKNSFGSASDWITVTEADQVFSGNVIMSAGGWTTIYFDTPFAYDGVSNVALIVDNNSQSWGSSTFRVIDSEPNQTIYGYSYSTNYDPCNLTGYTGTRMSVKNQVLFGIASYEYTVTASVNPEYSGTVSGGEGLYYYGQPATLTATANEGYCFYNWTIDGNVVSSNATYTFPVTGDMNLVANFGAPIIVTVTSNPVGGGTLTGDGGYGYNQQCTLTATANEGYAFVRWTKNGNPVSYYSTYTFNVTSEVEYVAEFQLVYPGIAVGEAQASNIYLPSYSSFNYSLSQQIYTAEEIGIACDINSLSFFNTGYQKTRSYSIYMVHTDKSSFLNYNDWISVTEADRVFTGSVTMVQNEWTVIPLDTPFSYNGTSNLAIIVNDNTGNWGSAMSCRVYNADGYQSIQVYDDYTVYNPNSPSEYYGSRLSVKNQIILGVTTSIGIQTIPLVEGWNWISTNIDANQVDCLAMLEASLGDHGLTIATSDDIAEYLGDGFWLGLEGYQWTNSEMIMVEVSEDCTVSLEGSVVNPSMVTITINPGWNWIGFPVGSEMSIVDALANFEPEYGDGIASYEGITEYIGTWTGDFMTFVPGHGYMYYSASATPKTLVFSTGAK